MHIPPPNSLVFWKGTAVEFAQAAVFIAGSNGTTTLLSTKHLNAVLQQLQVHIPFHAYPCYCPNTVLSLFTSSTPILYAVKECSQTTTHPRLFFSLLEFRENEYFDRYSTAVTDIVCMRCIVHMHLDTFTAHLFTT